MLYKVDGYSRSTFRLSIADTTVNPIVEVTSASSLYEIYDYGNGEYAIGFKDNTVTTAKYPTSVKLNIRLDGNANASATVTLKLRIQ